MDIELYQARFNALTKEPSLKNLTELQGLHLQAVPFENLDVIRRIPIYLNLNSIYDKIVMHHRGGYCYELNGLFHALLRELGYNAHLVAATVLRPTGKWAKADTHAAIIVQMDEPYLVDVGFGAASPRLPIPLNGALQTDIRASYKVTSHENNTFDLIRTSTSGERTLYRFTDAKKKLPDFHEGCVFNQVSNESSFTHTDIITRSTSTGQITLSDHILTEYDGKKVKTIVLSETEKKQTLQDIFKISLNEDE